MWTRVAVTRRDNYGFQLFNYTVGNAAEAIRFKKIIKRHFFSRFLRSVVLVPCRSNRNYPPPLHLFIRLSGRDERRVCSSSSLLLLLLLLLFYCLCCAQLFLFSSTNVSQFLVANQPTLVTNNFEYASRTKMKIVLYLVWTGLVRREHHFFFFPITLLYDIETRDDPSAIPPPWNHISLPLRRHVSLTWSATIDKGVERDTARNWTFDV